MPDFIITVGMDLIEQPDTWNLVRGLGEQTYDASAFFPSGQTGWALASGTPSGFSIDTDGEISISPAHAEADVTEVTVNTDQGDNTIPVSLRDYFPDDYPEADLVRFYSAFRSQDRTERDLWLADYFSPVSPAAFTTTEVTARSGDDGYIDIDALETACAAIGDNGILEVKEIYDQSSAYNGPFNLPHDADVGDRFLAGYMVDGTLTMLTQNGRPYLRSVWSPAALNTGWTADDRSDVQYTNLDASSFDDFHAIMLVIRRHGDAGSNFRSGDNNSYPGLKTAGDNSLRYSTKTRPSDIALTASEIQSWFMHIMDSIRNSIANSNYRRDHHFYELAGEASNTDSPSSVVADTSQVNAGGGMEIEANEWDWAELQVYNMMSGFAPGQDYEGTREELTNNLVHVFGGESFTY